VVAAIGIVGTLLYFGLAGDNNTDTTVEGWQPCGSADHNLSFKCPPGWELNEIINTQDQLSLILKKNDNEQGKIEVYGEEMVPTYSINVMVGLNEKDLDAKDFHLSNFAESSRAAENEKIEAISIEGEEGIKYIEGAAPSSGSSVGVLFTKYGRSYRFIYSALATPATHEKYMNVFNQMIETVQLVSG